MESDFEKRFDEMTERLFYAYMRRHLGDIRKGFDVWFNRDNAITQMSARMEEGY